MFRSSLAAFVAFFFWAALATAQVTPYDLSTEYLTAPVGIDTPKPRLSWKSKTADANLKNVVQAAYRIIVASTPELLADGKGDLWDTGKVESEASLNIEYAGKPLATSQRCYWKVKIWYKSGDQLPGDGTWSEPSHWIMGVMKPEDWKAKWIASEEEFRPELNIGGDAKWIWTGDAESLDKAPAGKRYYRMVFRDITLNDVNNLIITLPNQRPQKIIAEHWTAYTVLAITADDQYKVYINGKPATQTWGHFNDWHWMRFIDISKYIQSGENVIGVEVTNKEQGPTGLLASMIVRSLDAKPRGINLELISPTNDKLWLSSAEPTEGWNSDPHFKSDKWKPAVEVGPVDCQPWGKIERRMEKFSPAFGKNFSVTKKVRQATLHITGVGFYEASLNGRKIGNKVLDPAQTRYDKRVLYSTYDLTDTLKAGENRLHVLLGHGWYDVRSVAVWNFDNAPWRDFPRMIAQLEIVYDDGSKELVCSDDTWEQTESPIALDCIRQGESSMSSQLRKIGQAVVVDGPKGKLVAEAIPPSVITEEWKPVSITEPKPGVYVVDTGQNMAGWIRFKLDGQKPGDFIRIRYAERLAADGNVDMKPMNEHYRHHVPFMPGLEDMFQVDQFRCGADGGGIYEPRFMYHGFQYVEITGLTKKPAVDRITICAVNNDFKSAGKFECSNAMFNQIQQATLWAYRGNFVNGVPTDCPHREKNGWTGDAQLACEQAQYNWENTACYEKWICDLLDEQQPDGNLPGIVPTSGWGYAWGNGPAWDSALCIIPWMLYQYKGDKRMLEEAYPGMKKYVDYLSSRAKENGLVDHGLSDWCPANTKTDAVVTSSIYYFLDASIVARAAQIIGNAEDAEKYSALARKIADSYKKELYKGEGIIANGSQVAQSFALYYHAIPLGDVESVAKKLFEAVEKADNHLDVGILGAKSLFHTLSRHGRTDLALKILNQKTPPSYGSWLERGATTLWEDWGDGASRNHIMFGDISAWFYQTLGGITLDAGLPIKITEDKVGMKFFLIAPEFPEGIDWVNAEHDSPHGLIKSSWKKDGKKIVLNVSVPVNTRANILLRDPASREIDVREVGSGVYTFEIDRQ